MMLLAGKGKAWEMEESAQQVISLSMKFSFSSYLENYLSIVKVIGLLIQCHILMPN